MLRLSQAIFFTLMFLLSSRAVWAKDLVVCTKDNLAVCNRNLAITKSANGYLQRSWAYEGNGDLDRAIADAKEAARLGRNESTIYQVHLCELYDKKGEASLGIEACSELIRRDVELSHSESSGAYLARGRLYLKKGDREHGVADLVKAYKLNPSGHGVREQLAAAVGEDKIAGLMGSAPPMPPVDGFGDEPKSPMTEAASQTFASSLDRRVALVIGNSAYRNVQRLPNPANDANLIGAALRSTGFEDVTIAHDLDRDGMVAALKAFARKADAADWAVIYFAGHGIEVGGTNYLIPVDAKLETDRDVPEEAISLDQLQNKLGGAHKLKLIVLDACRNNPFASQMKMTVAHRSVSRGFTRFEPNGATLVVYAAKEGTTANDGDGVDSPFAVSFAKRIVERGVEITMVLRFVRQDVLVTTGNQQEPFVYGSLPPENFYFVPPK